MSEIATCYLTVPNLTEAEVIQAGLALKDQLKIQGFHYKQNAGLFIFPCENEWGRDGGHPYYAGDGHELIEQILRYLGIVHELNEEEFRDNWDFNRSLYRASFSGWYFDYWDQDGHAECPFNVRPEIMFDK